MKGLNTKARYQVKLMLAVAALALFYESPGWSTTLSGSGAAYMIIKKAKLESIKNLWWLTLSVVTCLSSFVLTVSHYVNLGFGYNIIAVDKCHLFQQCLASILVGSIISSALSEKEITDALLMQTIKVEKKTVEEEEEEENITTTTKISMPPNEAFDTLKDKKTTSSTEETSPAEVEESTDYDIPTDYEPQIITNGDDEDEKTPVITNKVDGGDGEGINSDDIVTSTTSLSSEGQ